MTFCHVLYNTFSYITTNFVFVLPKSMSQIVYKMKFTLLKYSCIKNFKKKLWIFASPPRCHSVARCRCHVAVDDGNTGL